MNNKNIKFAFWGTPDVASKTLEILKEKGFLPTFIITQEDKPQGRKMILTPPSVKIWAQENNIPFIQPNKIDSFVTEKIKNENIDISIVVAYGKILPEVTINTPKFGTINIHYSLLPKYRGASPVESAILNGDKETGVSIQQMRYKLDSGPIIADKIIEIGNTETKEELKNKLIKEGADLLASILPSILENNISSKEQNEDMATFCSKIKKEDGEIDFQKNPKENYNKFRAFYGWPGTFFFKNLNGKKTRYKITKAKLENDKFIIERVIPEGKKEQDYQN